jgi:hypothetical protein
LLLAVLVSIQLRAVGPRHAFGTRLLPSKPCRPLLTLLFYHAAAIAVARYEGGDQNETHL